MTARYPAKWLWRVSTVLRRREKKHGGRVFTSVATAGQSRIDKDEEEARNAAVMDLWLACYTQEEIAGELGWDKGTASRLIGSLLQDGKSADSQQNGDDAGPSLTKDCGEGWCAKDNCRGTIDENSRIRNLGNSRYFHGGPAGGGGAGGGWTVFGDEVGAPVCGAPHLR